MGTHPIFESDFDCLTDMVGFTERDIDDLTDIYINKVIYPSDDECDESSDSRGDESSTRERQMIQMPKSIYVTKLPAAIFSNEDLKKEFENLFIFGEKFFYFPNFFRCRVEFNDSLEACRARVKFHLFNFH